MANQDDIDTLVAEANQIDNLPRLKEIRDELLDIAQTMNQAALRSEDPTVRTMATELRDSAQYQAEDVRQRAAQIELDQMDPNYEARKQAKLAAQRAEEDKGKEMLGGFMKTIMGGGGQEGGNPLGSLLGGLMGNKDEPAAAAPAPVAPPAPSPAPPPATAAPAAAAGACASCGGALLPGAKFCPNCGAKAGPAMCTGCGNE